MKTPSLRLDAILFDIDETITTTKLQAVNYFNLALAGMLAERDGLTPERALDRILSVQRLSIRQDALFAAMTLGLSLDELLRRASSWMDENGFAAFQDARDLIAFAKSRGIRLFTATNNGVASIYAKLKGAGLADEDGSSPFERFYGDDSLGDSKENPDVYRRLLEREGLDGARVMMVGDNMRQDGLNAIAAGIGFAAIVDRSSASTLEAQGRIFKTNDLRALKPLIALE